MTAAKNAKYNYVSLLSNFRVCELLKSAVSILWQWCRFVFLFIGRELTTWPANNCLQIMVCSCSVSSNCVWLQIILCSCINETALFCFFASLLLENGRSLCFSKKFIKKHKLSDQTIKKKIIELQLSQNISIYQCVSQINCLPKLKAHHWQIMIFWSTSSKNKLLDIFISFQSVDCQRNGCEICHICSESGAYSSWRIHDRHGYKSHLCCRNGTLLYGWEGDSEVNISIWRCMYINRDSVYYCHLSFGVYNRSLSWGLYYLAKIHVYT